MGPRPFAYLRDPLFLACLVIYPVNRWLIKPHVDGGFVHTQLNDLICIPFWIPPLVYGLHLLGARRSEGPPTALEIGLPLLFWSLLFEVVLPRSALGAHHVADPRDVLAYAVGALGAQLAWSELYDAPGDVAPPS